MESLESRRENEDDMKLAKCMRVEYRERLMAYSNDEIPYVT